MTEHHSQQGGTPAIVITLPGHPPSPNRPGHPLTRWRRTAPLRDAVAWLARAQRPAVPFQRAHVCITLVRKGRSQPMDPDNAVAACKPLIDGLRIGGVLVDDSPAHIALDVCQEVGSRRETRITILSI
ncbi:MAG TPA: hypothetical protein VHB98_23985 [Chloroflexota bacterium]|nr:hypothetical protein [Chloroflexota bacterium]